MAKKRKAPGSSKRKDFPEENFNKRVRLNVDSYEDVAGSDDEFHIGRDKVLLDEDPRQKRSRKVAEEEEFLEDSGEEVLGYSDEDEADDLDAEDYDDAPLTKGGPKRKIRSDDEDEDVDEEDELNEWGTSKQDYYGADEMETEQDALDEEAEAKRLQQKQLESLTAADYGFDEDEWTGETQKDKQKSQKKSKTVTEVLPQLKVSEDMGPAERLKLLKSRYPEFEPLSKEFLDLQGELDSIQTSRKESRSQDKRRQQKYHDGPASPLEIKERAASAYLATLAMYFALLSSSTSENGTIATSATVLREHPVMESILSTRSLWQKVKDLPDDESDWESEADEATNGAETEAVEVKAPRDRKRKTRAQRNALAAQRAAEAVHAERMAAAEADLADLDDLLVRKPRKTTRAIKTNGVLKDDSDIGETQLTEKELADKAAKRKSLRFYTSQIAQKSNKRGAAGRSAGGDDDIPYRERLRDRQARLMAEAANKARKHNPSADLGGESGSEDEAQAAALRASTTDDDYYQLISNKKSAAKSEKESLAAAKKDAILNGGRVVEQEEIGPDGKRKISYAIEKNKGLTPHRKKDVRNPRVKKRKKYDEKKKKLATMRPVYKGGEGRGGYGGELSGIKSNLVKSRKL
ncbi:Sas10 C-terminal domain-containing protein [Elsinoe ampelina]|uniref:Sas10 C-terminal domain-containing protein n=1 Tax=Elsinoe ampelina TaxID=302913 RepID=A0A6A6GBI4_9PEZI|nr:Sas10 C-terminal domain-containing protein [Elsinoe ampelina]